MIRNVLIVICAIGAGAGIYIYNSQPSVQYGKAEQAFARNDYRKAIKYYSAVGDYKDAIKKLEESELANEYSECGKMMDSGDYAGAKTRLEALSGYEDSEKLIRKCSYQIAVSYKEGKEYALAAKLFQESDGYEDAEEQISAMGEDLVKSGDCSVAAEVFGYAENKERDPYALYADGMMSMKGGDHDRAAEYFGKAGGILDAADQYQEAQYEAAQDSISAKDYEKAGEFFEKIPNYKDSEEMIRACRLMVAKNNVEEGKLSAAKELLEKLPSKYSYQDVSVSELSDILNANSNWVAISGKWASTSGTATTNCQARTYSYDGGTWTMTFDNEGQYTMDLSCALNDDGTVTVNGKGSFGIFENWSTIQEGLKYDQNYTVSFSKKIMATDFGSSIEVDDCVTITPSSDGIHLNYSKKDENNSVSFVYIYKTDMMYGKKISGD